jgi:YHS domain-containing protein
MKTSTLTTLVLITAAFSLRAVAAEPPIKLKTKPYPLEVCVISDEKLGSMGDPFVFVEGDQEIQLCCKSCQKDFTNHKEENLKKLEAAWKKVKRYPLTACIASDEPIDPQEAVGLVHEGREFIFCCKSCIKEFKKDPAKFVKKFDEAAAKKKS